MTRPVSREGALSRPDFVARFWSKVDMRGPKDCWAWTGARTSGRGYGYVTGKCVSPIAHRIAYELLVGPVPDGLTLDHLCRNRLCVNPRHLEPVTNRENILRGTGPSAVNARRTHCVHGHPFDETNTVRRVRKGTVERICLACRRERNATRRSVAS